MNSEQGDGLKKLWEKVLDDNRRARMSPAEKRDDERVVKELEMITQEKLQLLGDRMMEIGASMVKMQATIHSRLKEDDSPVTAADLKAEGEIIEMAEHLFPGWPTVSEETNSESIPGPTYKSIDGLDGT